MKEELQIDEAARLAGTKAPIELSGLRARAFVASTLGNDDNGGDYGVKAFYARRPFVAWGSTLLATAACFIIAFMTLKPSGNYGQPGSLMEYQSDHAGISVLDSTVTSSPDSAEITVSETLE